jgi:hypothetical protein
VTNGENAILADEPRAFAHAVVGLIRDVERRRHIETAARTLVLERYDWSAVAGELEEALTRFARGRVAELSGGIADFRLQNSDFSQSAINLQSEINHLQSQGDPL